MKIYLLIIFFLLGSYASNAQKNGDIKKVNETIAKFFDGFSKRDISIIKKHITQDFILIENAELWNADTISNRFEKANSMAVNYKRINAFDFIKTEISGNTAWVAYHNTATIVSGDKQRIIKWLESAILLKQGDDWKIQMMHSTPEKKRE